MLKRDINKITWVDKVEWKLLILSIVTMLAMLLIPAMLVNLLFNDFLLSMLATGICWMVVFLLVGING